MDKQIITFSANEQNLVRIGGEYHYSSNKVSYIGAHFDLGANWDGFGSVRAVWFTDRVNGISTVLDGEGNCTVPTEVLKKKDRVFVNLVGSIVSNGELTDRLTTYPAVALVVDSKAKVDSTEAAPVTPSQFEQFVSIVQDAVANIKDIVSTTLNADYTLTFVYSDGTSYTTPSIRGERGPQGADGADGADGNGIASAVLNSNYTLTLTFTDGASYTTPSIRGAQGPKGDPGDVSQAQLDAAVSDLKSDINAIDNAYAELITSRNIFTPTEIRVYPDANGSASIAADKTITASITATLTNLWITQTDEMTLEAGDYVLCVDHGLYNYGITTLGIDYKVGSGSWTQLVSATGDKTPFTIANDLTAKFRIGCYLGSLFTPPLSWSGHVWIDKGEEQEYMPVGQVTKTYTAFVDENQGEENAGKLLGVGSDGTVETIDSFSNIVEHELYRQGNLLDYTKVSKGYIKSDGDVQPYGTLWCSDFCEVQQGTLYQFDAVYSQYFAFYDENKDFLASYDTLGQMQKYTQTIYKIDVPVGAKYFRCTYGTDQAELKTAWICNIPEFIYDTDLESVSEAFPYTRNPVNPCDYSELTVRAFSKVVCIGDSLTYGGFNLSNDGTPTGETQSSSELSIRYSYPSNFQRITGIDTTNKGDSGETSVSWYSSHQNDDFSQYDLAIIFLGVNDSAFQVSDADTLTAMQNIVNMLNTARSDMRIAVCSCIPAYDGVGYQAKGQLILNWAKGLNNPNIIPLDLAQYSHVKPRTSYVAGHCSALGYYMMALDIARYISWYMDNNMRDFRFIQFIGSPDAEWDYD